MPHNTVWRKGVIATSVNPAKIAAVSDAPRQKFPVLSPRDVAICERVKQVREELRYSQAEFAEVMGLSRDQLASVEVGRVPLKYAPAARMCERFNVNQRWLNSGHRPKFFWIPVSVEIESAITPDSRFAEAFTESLEHVVVARMMDCAGSLGCTIHDLDQHVETFAQVPGIAANESDAITNTISRYVQRAARVVPTALYADFFAHMTEACNEFFKKNKLRWPQKPAK